MWGVEPRGCPTLFAFAYSNFPATATVPPLRSFPLSSEASPADNPVQYSGLPCYPSILLPRIIMVQGIAHSHSVLFHISLVFTLYLFVECGESNPVAVLRSSLSLIPTFRPLQPCHPCGLSRCHPRQALPPIRCSTQGFRVILQSCYLV